MQERKQEGFCRNCGEALGIEDWECDQCPRCKRPLGQTRRRRLTEDDFERMNLPEEFWRAKVQQVSEKVRPAIIQYLKKIVENVSRGTGFTLRGATGVGKSSIASLILKEARIHGFTGFFVTVWELKEAVRSRLMFDDTRTVLDRCREVHVLVLDDLGLGDLQGGFGERFVEGLIAYRGSRRRVTVVTTRLEPMKLREELGQFINTLNGYCPSLLVRGPDLRERSS